MQQAHRSEDLRYLLYRPARHRVANPDPLPLILFLHGSGERGDDPALVKKWGLPREVESQPDLPYLLLSPLCPLDVRWTDLGPAVMGLLDEVLASHAVDPARVYLTGFSMGGQGAWSLAVEHAGRFAAVAPVAGRIPPQPGFLERLCALGSLPVWVFHGLADDIVPAENSQILAQTLEACGGNVRLTLYPGLGHVGHGETSDAAYGGSQLTDWLLSYRRKSSGP